ncbi:hypothetical protein PGTUg99_022196 [Puccinia graminis f. sp. tritici]|uniref:Uncharacterized protein n=1 Tax=Puccinia graminis f. sp. tritici TaxID=56615 RepID=A0A5B0Q8X3_PUCGR|nr:hypothetical protein PGTUg99_022196 [Puccinia graminis f. sp. tritici]
MDELDTLASHQLRQQAGFAMKLFQRLVDHDYNLRLNVTASDLRTQNMLSKGDLFTELHSTLLPLLRSHISSLSVALRNSASLRINQAPTLKCIIEIQMKLELTLDQTIYILNDILPGQLLAPSQTNDQHFKQFKFYRLRRLESSIKQRMRGKLALFFSNCRRLIEETTTPGRSRTLATFSPAKALQSIDLAIRWSSSELNLIYFIWIDELSKINTLCVRLSAVADPDQQFYNNKLYQSFKPVIKLSRLFFRKITTAGMTNKQAPFYTEMSSYQLNLLEETVGKITGTLTDFVRSFEQDNQRRPESARVIIPRLKNLTTLFQSCLFLTDLYIVPVLADVPSQTYLKTWVVTWNTLFYQATHNATKACESFQPA